MATPWSARPGGFGISGSTRATVSASRRPAAPPGYALREDELGKPDVILNRNHPLTAEGERPREKWSFRRSNYFAHVGEECRHVHEKVGLLDMTAFAKWEVSGPGAEAWLGGL